MKKKWFLFAIAALTVCVMASCGNKGSKDKSESNDTEQVENDDDPLTEEEVTDGVTTAPEEDWTEEAVANMLRMAYDDVNVIYGPRVDDMEPNLDLYAMYCTRDFNEMVNEIRAIDAQKDDIADCFFAEEDLIWNYWGEGVVEPKNIQVTLLTGNMAEATFQLTHGQEWLQTKVALCYENGQWRIADWLQVGDDESSKRERMEVYLQVNR